MSTPSLVRYDFFIVSVELITINLIRAEYGQNLVMYIHFRNVKRDALVVVVVVVQVLVENYKSQKHYRLKDLCFL